MGGLKWPVHPANAERLEQACWLVVHHALQHFLLDYPVSFLQILDVTGFLKYAVQSSAQFEARFNAVERILQYRKLEPESARKVSRGWQTDNNHLLLPCLLLPNIFG